jgi:hypothetical protein
MERVDELELTFGNELGCSSRLHPYHGKFTILKSVNAPIRACEAKLG